MNPVFHLAPSDSLFFLLFPKTGKKKKKLDRKWVSKTQVVTRYQRRSSDGNTWTEVWRHQFLDVVSLTSTSGRESGLVLSLVLTGQKFSGLRPPSAHCVHDTSTARWISHTFKCNLKRDNALGTNHRCTTSESHPQFNYFPLPCNCISFKPCLRFTTYSGWFVSNCLVQSSFAAHLQ